MILITGGMGFIGLNTARAFLDAGADVVLTRFATSRTPDFLEPHLGRRAFVEKVDIRDPQALIELGGRHAITGIVHLASPAMHGPVGEGLRDNFLALLNVLEAGNALGVKRVLLASSIAVYAGVATDAPWREDTLLPIASPYPMTAYKKVFEILSDSYASRTKLSVINVRMSSYGPLTRGMYFLPARLVHAAVKGIPGPELTAGQVAPHEDDTLDFSYIKDTAEAIVRLQLAPTLNHSIYNIGGGHSPSNRELADAVRKAVPGARIQLQPGGSGAPLYPALDISRLKADTGWSPRFSLEAGIADYVDWLRAGNPY